MSAHDDEDTLLRSVAIQNANSILQARQRAERDLLEANQALGLKTEELAHSLSMLRATLESTTDGILVTDEAGKVTVFNEKYIEMWQVPPEVMRSGEQGPIVTAASRHLREPLQFMERIEIIYLAAPAETFDVLQLADGRVFERFSKIQMVNGRNVGRVWSFRDVTERQLLLERERAARAEAERASALKDEFLATLSHELRTPLSAILGWTQLLRRGDRARIDVDKGLDTIERSARVQTQLIEDLLDMSRIVSGKMRLDIQSLDPASFVAAAIETVRPAAEAKGMRLDKLLDPAAGPVHGDPGRLQQVVWNLLANAIKFTPKAGRVQILLQRVNSHIEIIVADTGIGIKPEFLAHVFERFRQADSSTTRSYGGLGLGLSIVKHLVELHGGTIQAHSAGEDLGSTFTVSLPLAVVHRGTGYANRVHPRTPPDVASGFEHIDLSGIKVLVVDDEDDALELLRRILAECNAVVRTARTAAEALLLIEEEKPDVLVSDIGMPHTDGYELLRRVRSLGADRGGRVPAIALTAFARSEDRTRALRAGFQVHVAKPVDSSELVATVASVAGRSG